MKRKTKQYNSIAFSFTLFGLLFSLYLHAQQQKPNDHSSFYTQAIEKIIDYENAQLTQQEILFRLNASPSPQKAMFVAPNTLPTFQFNPFVEFVEFHGNDAAILDCIYTTDVYTLDTVVVDTIEYIDGMNWISDTLFGLAYDSLFVTVNLNDTSVSRLAKIKATAIFSDTIAISDSAYILQGTAPDDNYILISPQLQVIDYTIQTTDTFSIINNVANWEVKISSLPDWIPTYNEDHINNYISFNVNSNESDSFRQDTIVIQEVGDPSVSDTLTIIQGALSDSIILVTPEIQSVDYTDQATAPFHIISFNTNGWMTGPLPSWITASIEDHEGDSIIFDVAHNPGDILRQATVVIRDSLDADIFDELTIYQGALSDSVILVTPEIQSVDYTAQTTAPFHIISFNTNGWMTGTLPSWITVFMEDHEGDSIIFDVAQNQGDILRQATVVIRDSLDANIFDELTILQTAQSTQPIITINPVQQSIQWDGGETNNFIISHYNITDWEVDTISLPSWIAVSDSSHGSSNDTIRFNVAENLGHSLRVGTIKIWDVGDITSFQELTIYQGSQSTSSVLISPKIQSIAYAGDTTDHFNVIHFNINYWEVDTTSLPAWITVGDSSHGGTNDYVKFYISENPGNNYRDTTIIIRDTLDSTIADTLTIVQGAFSVPSILVSPEIQTISYAGGNTDSIHIIHFNISDWIISSTLPVWISVNDSIHGGTEDHIQFHVLENVSGKIRDTIVVIQDSLNPDVVDTLRIIQSASPFPQILAAPREQSIAHTGNDSVAFHVITVNTDGNWLIDTNTLKPWISNFTYVYSDSVFVLEVDSNLTLESRIDSITIYAYNAAADSTVYDTVAVYQYSGLDSYLLAEPRERSIHYPKDTVEFKVTAVNTDSLWAVYPTTVKEWIHYSYNYTDSLLTLVIDSNYKHTTRRDTITIYAIDGDSVVEDEISIYQYAGPEAFLLAAPRDLPIVHTGNDSVAFKITAVNTSGDWMVDTLSLANWVNYSYSYTDSLLILSVDTNLNLETRWDSIRIYAPVGDTLVADTVVIYQYSGLDSYLLSDPRERSIVYAGDSVSFKITAVNIDSIWYVDSTSVKNWISFSYNRLDSLMVLHIDENQSQNTRSDTIRIFATAGDSIVDDFVAVYQGSHPQPFLFVAPREQSVLHTGNEDVEFKVTTVNVDSVWLVDPETIKDWVLGFSYIYPDSLLSLDVSPNTTLQSRRDSVRIYVAAGDTILEDTITIYQFSGYDSYILAEPHEKSIGYLGDTVDFKITSVNIDSLWIVDSTTVKEWIHYKYNYVDSLLTLEIEENFDLQTRRDTIRIYATAGDSVVEDFIAIYQFARPQSLLMVSPREQSVGHKGNSSLVFKVNTVNTDGNWLVDSATVKDWVLDFTYNYIDSLLILNVDTNRTLYARRDSVRIYALADNVIVADTCSVYQYSGLDAYILAGPKGVESPHTGSDSIGFIITSANIGDAGWAYEFLSDTGQWVTELSSVADTLSFSVMANDKYTGREEYIRIYDVETASIADTVSIVQEAPYIILRPSSVSNITPHGKSITINIFSNIDEYTIKKDITDNADTSWYSHQDKYFGHFNDSIELTIEEHEYANATRSGKLAFIYNENMASNFYFMQREAPKEYITISGQILINGDANTPLVNNQVFIGDTVTVTDNSGFFSTGVLKGWKGTITPEVVDNFFDPPFVEYVQPVIADVDTNNFIAYPIDPQLTFSLLKTWACEGDELSPDHTERYPRADITGSVGEITYHWEVDPYYENAISNDSIKNPTFSTMNAPSDSVTFTLKINNFGFQRYDSFTLIIKLRPNEVDFSGELEVCKNQAGVLYLANLTDSNDERFSWSLPDGGGSFATDPKTNIAIVNWGNMDGDYEITLKTSNQFCPAATQVMKTVSISNQEAPPQTTIFWKSPDNMLYCTDSNVDYYVWGWFEMKGTELGDMTFIEGKHDWYVRLPEGHTFDPLKYHYFADTYYDSIDGCSSRSFYNPPLDIAEVEEARITVFPNPTSGEINIDFTNFNTEQMVTLQLYNMSGQLIHQEEMNLQSNEQTVQISGLTYQKSGIYFLRIMMDDYFFNSKIVVR